MVLPINHHIFSIYFPYISGSIPHWSSEFPFISHIVSVYFPSISIHFPYIHGLLPSDSIGWSLGVFRQGTWHREHSLAPARLSEMKFNPLSFHVPFGNQTWLAGKSHVNGTFNGKIILKWSILIFHCHVWLPEGNPIWFIGIPRDSSIYQMILIPYRLSSVSQQGIDC